MATGTDPASRLLPCARPVIMVSGVGWFPAAEWWPKGGMPMEGYPVPWWGWLVTLLMILLWIGLAAGIVNLVLWLARAFRLGEEKEKSGRPGGYYRG